MSCRILRIAGHRRELLRDHWELARAPAGSTDAEPSAARDLDWRRITRLDTVGACLRALGDLSFDHIDLNLDAHDWWYRLRFDMPELPASRPVRFVIGFEGLATLAQVWLNGHSILQSDNMFVAHELPIERLERSGNELLLRFRAVDPELALKRPRPRWRAPMVGNQQLRWLRTSLLGHTPGWSPPIPTIGPWRDIWLESRDAFEISDLDLRAELEGSTGRINISLELPSGSGERQIQVSAARNGCTHSAVLRQDAGCSRYSGTLEIADVDPWWPHTHGEPALYSLSLQVDATGHAPASTIELGEVGFRTIELDTRNDDFALRINGTPILCRGACWMPLDALSPQSQSGAALEQAFDQISAAGFNMLRVSGTTAYEGDAFLDACDRRGVLLWQDFMFANMDYPEDNEIFARSVHSESTQLLRRLQGRPCVAILCGNSEGEQQAAMWGAARERWQPKLFHETLRERSSKLLPQVPYWPSSAHGGAFPHQNNFGTTSYYGVGAYRRPLSDARISEVRFASECLAFANVPEDTGLPGLLSGPSIKVHHALWKARVPRDLGAGWDFDDVRDHYLELLFGTRALDLRYAEHDRYLAMSRIASGEVMAAVFRDWRRGRSLCRGGLIWFLRDLWPGAGWGIIDAQGVAKSPWYFVRRVLQPRAVLLTDEGTNGLYAHLINESARVTHATLEIVLLKATGVQVERIEHAVELSGRENREVPLASLLSGFMDLTNAYRFGPPVCDVVVASLRDSAGGIIARDHFFPAGFSFAQDPDVGLAGTVAPLESGTFSVNLRAARIARYVTLEAPGFEASDQYFHVIPGIDCRIEFRPRGSPPAFKCHVRAANSLAGCRLDHAS